MMNNASAALVTVSLGASEVLQLDETFEFWLGTPPVRFKLPSRPLNRLPDVIPCAMPSEFCASACGASEASATASSANVPACRARRSTAEPSKRVRQFGPQAGRLEVRITIRRARAALAPPLNLFISLFPSATPTPP